MDNLLRWRSEFPILEETVACELLRRNILIDYQPRTGIRIAPHFYRKDEELELVMREIKSILESIRLCFREYAVA